MSKAPEKSTETPAVRVDSTLSKGLSILETLAGSPKGRGVTELSQILGLSKSNTFRLLRSLSELGYVRMSENKAYSATLKVWQVGQTLMDNIDLPALCAPHMLKLSQEFGEAIYLAVPEGLSVIYIDKLESTQPIRSFTPKGGTAPIHCVGTGKAILAANYEQLREQLKGNLKRYTDNTITSMQRMDKDMASARANGYAIDTAEYRDGIYSFGAAILMPTGEAIAAIGVSVPEVNLKGNRAEEISLAVGKQAAEASRMLAS